MPRNEATMALRDYLFIFDLINEVDDVPNCYNAFINSVCFWKWYKHCLWLLTWMALFIPSLENALAIQMLIKILLYAISCIIEVARPFAFKMRERKMQSIWARNIRWLRNSHRQNVLSSRSCLQHKCLVNFEIRESLFIFIWRYKMH